MISNSDASIILIYDGECPFCSSYARPLRLKKAAGGIALVNARDPHPLTAQAWARGYDLNKGMLAIINGRDYYGEDALQVLALLSSRSGFFNRLNYHIFRHAAVASFLYPMLRAGRNTALFIRGAGQIAREREL